LGELPAQLFGGGAIVWSRRLRRHVITGIGESTSRQFTKRSAIHYRLNDATETGVWINLIF